MATVNKMAEIDDKLRNHNYMRLYSFLHFFLDLSFIELM